MKNMSFVGTGTIHMKVSDSKCLLNLETNEKLTVKMIVLTLGSDGLDS